MGIEKNKMVTVTYDLKIDDKEGEMIEQASTENPLKFIFGAGIMLPKFESYLENCSQGEDFEIKLEKNDAYGEVNRDAVVDLPKNVFIVEGKFDDELIKVGNAVPMMSSNGQRLNGLVLEIKDETVKMDFNHPLAGEDLFFKGSILEVRNATDEEIAQLTQGGCGCDSGGCSTEGCEDENCGSEGKQKDACGSGCGC